MGEINFPLGVKIGFIIFVVLFIFGAVMGVIEKIKKKRLPKWRGIFGIGLTVIILVSIIHILTFNDSSSIPETTRPRYAPLNAEVRIENGNMLIQNLNTYPWSKRSTMEGDAIKIELNDDFVYYHRLPIWKGKGIRIPLGEFADSKGRRFSLLFFKPLKVLISCSEDTGIYRLN